MVRWRPSVDSSPEGGARAFDHVPAIPRVAAGSWSAWIALDDFDVLTIRNYPTSSDAGGSADLSGTVVESSAPVAVFAGAEVGPLPFGWMAFDHLEEAVLPTTFESTEVVLSRVPTRYGEPAIFRLVAGESPTTLTFDPPVPELGATLDLAAGAWRDIETPSSVHVIATAPFSAGQRGPSVHWALESSAGGYAVAADGAPLRDDTVMIVGDPDLVAHPPASSFTPRHVVRTGERFDFDYVVITRPAGARVAVDCVGDLPETSFRPIGGSRWEEAVVFFDRLAPSDGTCSDGAHLVESDAPIGVIASGASHYNSYAFVAGLALPR